ncbi:MAG: potassium-transporting ATPase subunit KdpB [Chlamydiae bacterium]|nr:potassium-transporting ATPase subunit KdpB [Chlamydiota bacterium]
MNTKLITSYNPPLFKVLIHSLIKCNPVTLFHNPLIFITEIGAIITTLEALFFTPSAHVLGWQITLWLWLTVLIANIAETLSEFQTASLTDAVKKTRSKIMAYRKEPDESFKSVCHLELQKNDLCRVRSGEIIPADGQIVEGSASIDESVLTGETHPIFRSTRKHDTVIAGSKVLSEEILICVSQSPGHSYLDKLLALAYGQRTKKSQSEKSLSLLLSSLTAIFLVVIISFQLFGFYYHLHISLTNQVAFFICLIPTTIAGLLCTIRSAGISRLFKQNILSADHQALEIAGNVDILIFDKTGTLTSGNKVAYELMPALGVPENEFHTACYYSSIKDLTNEGKSIIEWLQKNSPRTSDAFLADAKYVPFNSETRLSGVDLGNIQIRKGGVDCVLSFLGQSLPEDISYCVQRICERGGSPLLVASNTKILGVVFLKDQIKLGLSEKFASLRNLGVSTLLVTGDNAITAGAIAGESDIDEVIANITPQQKLQIVKDRQEQGLIVGMIGDGMNDTLALKQADLSVAMHDGHLAAQQVANMIDLDSNPSKLYDIVQIGKQMQITKGALTTFSLASDIAKYFIILPAILTEKFPLLAPFNILQLSSPQHAIISTVIFNTLILGFLMPLAYKGVKLIPTSTTHIFNHNLLVYGLGGILAPFVAIKCIDALLNLAVG